MRKEWYLIKRLSIRVFLEFLESAKNFSIQKKAWKFSMSPGKLKIIFYQVPTAAKDILSATKLPWKSVLLK